MPGSQGTSLPFRCPDAPNESRAQTARFGDRKHLRGVYWLAGASGWADKPVFLGGPVLPFSDASEALKSRETVPPAEIKEMGRLELDVAGVSFVEKSGLFPSAFPSQSRKG